MSKETTMNHPMKFTLLTLTWNRSKFVASAHSAEVILLPGGQVCVCVGGGARKWEDDMLTLKPSNPRRQHPSGRSSVFWESLSALALCNSEPSGLQHKPTLVGIVGTGNEDVLFSHLFWLNNAPPTQPHDTNTTRMHFSHLLLQAMGNVISSLWTSCVCTSRNTR